MHPIQICIRMVMSPSRLVLTPSILFRYLPSSAQSVNGNVADVFSLISVHFTPIQQVWNQSAREADQPRRCRRSTRITVHAGEELGIWRFCGAWLSWVEK
jgi:hypothetical protein